MSKLSLNAFSLIKLRADNKSQCTYCTCTEITVVFVTYDIGQTPSSLKRYFVQLFALS